MTHPPHKQEHAIYNRFIITALVCLAVAIALFVFPVVPASAITYSITQTTVADFNTGFFYHTGLTRDAAGGGDGDGEVRLLTVGIACNTWNPGGTANATGLAALQGHAAVQKNGYIYVSGGQTTASVFDATANVYYAQINAITHNLGNWTATSPLPAPRKYHAMVTANNFVYVIGGVGTSLAATNTVLFAPINSNGSLGSWAATSPIQVPVYDLTSVVVNGTIYVIGGQGNSAAQTAVYYATPDAGTGAISTWNTATAPLPKPVMAHASAVYSNTIYIAGGGDINNPSPPYYPYYADVTYTIPSALRDITVFTSTIPMQNNLIYGSGTAFAGQLYDAGGAFNGGTTLTNTIASNLIDPGGPLSGSWTNSDCLSSARQRAASIMSNDGWLYVVEGNPGTGLTPLNTIDYGPTSSPSGHYVSSGNFQSSIIDLGTGGHPILSIDWNAMVSSTVTMTLQYRMGNNSDLSDGTWQGPFYANVNNSAPQTNQVPIGNTSSPPDRYVQYRVALGTNNNTQSPALNWVRVNYDVPYIPDFAITGLSAPPELGIQFTQIITYWVKDNSSTAASMQRANSAAVSPPAPAKPASGQKIPLPPTSLRSSPSKSAVPSNPPEPDYLFRISFYADPPITPTTPISLTGAMVGCIDYNNPLHGPNSFPPWIWWNPAYGSELTKAPKVFYAQCPVPAHTKKFWAQIDTCDPNNDPNNWCKSYGYVLESDETRTPPSYTDNIIGPVNAGQSQGGGNLFFLPFIRRQ